VASKHSFRIGILLGQLHRVAVQPERNLTVAGQDDSPGNALNMKMGKPTSVDITPTYDPDLVPYLQLRAFGGKGIVLQMTVDDAEV
jgi:hypothetical protein